MMTFTSELSICPVASALARSPVSLLVRTPARCDNCAKAVC